MSEGGRPRRARKAVDYAKEQEFSDDDVFEDHAQDSEPDVPASAPSSSRRRRGGGGGRRPKAEPESDEDFGPEKPVFTEKGYDPNLLPLRDRFPFLPEFEADGSPRIDLIVGRRPIKKGGGAAKPKAEEESPKSKRRGGGRKKQPEATREDEHVEYEYLIKWKGKSYLHLEWKTGADLESMNKSAKGIYRRYLKKIQQGTEEDIENPEFDPSYAQPEKVVDEAEHEVVVELTDKELIDWEKEREKELDEESEDEVKVEGVEDIGKGTKKTKRQEEKEAQEDREADDDDDDDGVEELDLDEDLNFATIPIDRLRKLLNKDGTYYPVVKGSDNPYRDGYVTEPPKKARASYLIFQCSMRPYFQKRNPDAPQSELMKILGDAWQNMTAEEQAPFLALAKEEQAQCDKEKAMLEKAQKPNEVWQPMRRCLKVLDRICEDGFANIFLEPVDPEEFPDYHEVVDQPMDLGTVRQKLISKKYQMVESFARDMRKIWNNCKVYNQHGSAIWFVADYMSKQFERLYHAWVSEFRDRYLRWAHRRARPWEPTCRKCDGKCGTPDDKMVLCDHCDANYGMECIKMKKIPDYWHCPECKPKLKSNKSKVRLFSAVAETAARRKAEMGEIPKKKVNQKMYLVKWAGLGYEFCTWETKGDINDDKLIQEYYRLNNETPDEPDLTEEEVDKLISDARHITLDSAGGIACIPDLRLQLYSQSRAFQFSKFGSEFPELLAVECGPKSQAASLRGLIEGASALATCAEQKEESEKDAGMEDASEENPGKTNSSTDKAPEEVPSDSQTSGAKARPPYVADIVECVQDMKHRVIHSQAQDLEKICPKLPPLMTGEYDAIIPITSKGLLMNVGEVHGCVAFLGYRSFPDGTKGPAELNNVIRHVGDRIIAVDGRSTIDKSFKEVIGMLRESGKNKFAFMRFFENRYTGCSNHLTSLGKIGGYAYNELGKQFSLERGCLLVQRKQLLLDTKEEEEEKENDSDGSVRSDDNESDNSDSEASEGEFEPDSEDEEMAETRRSTANEQSQGEDEAKEDEKENETIPDTAKSEEKKEDEKPKVAEEPTIHLKQETTRSLAFRLLDVDLGYSSDEAGEEDCLYYVDGVDSTFTTSKIADGTDEEDEEEEEEEKAGQGRTKKQAAQKKKNAEDDDEKPTVPVSRNDFAALGDRAKLNAAIAVTRKEPDPSAFENFPLPSEKELEAIRKAEEESKQKEANALEPQTKLKRSTVKVEQVDNTTGESVRVWANAETAAATLQLSLERLKGILKGQYDEEHGDEIGGYRWRFALSGAEVTAPAGGANDKKRGNKQTKDAYLEFRDKLYDPDDPHHYKNGNRLRDYQVDGVNWLAGTWYRKHSCILADEMGLGKTVQIVTYIEHLYRVEKIKRPYLVVVPLSTVEHWRREFLAWTDMVCCVYHDRQRVWRDVMREYEWYFADRPHTPDYLKFDVLVTTYDTLIGDFDIIGQVPWRVAVVDEAHRLRNIKGKLLECMKEISAKGTLQYGFQSRVLMTGTPLQNNTQELWTLLNFIEPFKFPSLEDFQNKYGNMANREQVEALQKTISPYMLRRVKEDVAKDIPAKEETVIDVELTAIQKQYYRAIFEHNHAFLNLGATRTNAPKLMNIQMELRKCCNHPFLLEGVEQRETERLFKEYLENGKLDGTSPEEQQGMLNESGYIMTSGKMVLLDKLLPKLRDEGHKVLVFSQMVKMLDLISDYCDFRGFRFERLDGRVRGNERQKAIDRFETEDDSFMFLLSTRAGGVGINLTAADTCIIFDSDWNPQNDVQAQARCHRIGQTKDVRIYRLVTSRTFEQEMFDRASKKLGLEQAILGTYNQDNDDDKPTSKEMEQLLKKGAYALLDDDNDAVTKEFCADDIDAILAKRTRTRVVEGAKTANWLNKQGMVVSKSKFSADGSGVNVDDPDFWQKVMPDFVTPEIMLNRLNELSEAIEGKVAISRGRRGKRRKKKKPEEESGENPDSQNNGDGKEENEKQEDEGAKDGDAETAGEERPAKEKEKKDDAEEGAASGDADENDDEGGDGDGEGEEEEEQEKKVLSRTNQRKVNKYMSELKSMMDGLLEEAEDDALQSSDKSLCQKLLLTISVKESMFNDEQRKLARNLLKRLEGDRRRRCRTSTDGGSKLSGRRLNEPEAPASALPNELLIVSSKKQKKRRRRKGEAGKKVDNDGYLQHSDSENDWSDVGEDIYQGKKRASITSKEASRRRAWTQGDDAATAAGRPWPGFPRHVVAKVLGTVIEKSIEYDQSKGGMFSEPVSKEEYPEYYEQIKKPMDYSTMKQKLENGEYRSAQAMQKDFVLVVQNCIQFNDNDSEVVKEARQQLIMRPKILRDAAALHKLFLAEDGSVLEIVDDKKKKDDKSEDGTAKKKKRRRKKAEIEEEEEEEKPEKKEKKIIKRTRKRKKPDSSDGGDGEPEKDIDDEGLEDDEDLALSSLKKPRIKINVSNGDDAAEKGTKKGGKKKRKAEDNEHDDETTAQDDEAGAAPLKKRKRKKTEPYGPDSGKKKSKKKAAAGDEKVSAEAESKPQTKSTTKKAKVVDAEREDDGVDVGQSVNLYLDLKLWKAERSGLKKKDFAASRRHFTKRGPWVLPEGVEDGQFTEIANAVLTKMGKHDSYDVFANAVTEEEAPGYHDIVKNPMDFNKMKTKIDNEEYGEGSDAAAALYHDFLLVFDNCALYNDEGGDVLDEAARLFGLLPETYVGACCGASNIT